MIEKLLLKLRARDTVSAEEEAALRDAVGEVRNYPADSVIIREGDEISVSTLQLDGLVCRYKDLRDGSRQISALHVPGDFVDLHGFSLKRLDHSILALTPCRMALVPHARLAEISEQHPHLTRLLWFLTNLDASIHRAWVLSLGRRSSMARTAHLFCELRARLEVVGLADETGYALPVIQAELAECLGMTSIHMNRTLRQLREQSLVEFRGGRVTILDRAALERVAEFSPDYLCLERRPR